MAYNLFIAYDLIPPGQNYDAVRERIRQLGRWYQVQYSLFYVHSSHDIQQAHNHVRAVMDDGDKLTIIDANNAFVSFVPTADLAALRTEWAK